MEPSKPQPIPSPNHHPSKYRKVTTDPHDSQDNTQRLLSESPNYTSNCDLYPKAMRDIINESTSGAVVGRRDPEITREAEQNHRHSVHEQQKLAATDPDKVLCFYPGAARHSAPK
ncbi:hypothetical protein GGF43_006390 [Coemansia sp. RSA 2618]|nr:hypothetical protein GGF43_006390 [Coemansia sp. RSA 2618]